VRALGTAFVVRNDPQGLAVTLIEGKVSVASKSGQVELLLAPGERASFGAGKRMRIDRPELNRSLAWRRGQVVLDDTPLASAVEEMNRYSPLELTVERPQAAALLINGLFQAGDSRSFARAVASTYGLEVVDRGDRIVLAGIPSTPESGARPERH
jgi:transmembrane sensor